MEKNHNGLPEKPPGSVKKVLFCARDRMKPKKKRTKKTKNLYYFDKTHAFLVVYGGNTHYNTDMNLQTDL